LVCTSATSAEPPSGEPSRTRIIVSRRAWPVMSISPK
jgi:hypothetical protein